MSVRVPFDRTLIIEIGTSIEISYIIAIETEGSVMTGVLFRSGSGHTKSLQRVTPHILPSSIHVIGGVLQGMVIGSSLFMLYTVIIIVMQNISYNIVMGRTRIYR